MCTSAPIRPFSTYNVTDENERLHLARSLVTAAQAHAENHALVEFFPGTMELLLEAMIGEMTHDQLTAALARFLAGRKDQQTGSADDDALGPANEFAFLNE